MSALRSSPANFNDSETVSSLKIVTITSAAPDSAISGGNIAILAGLLLGPAAGASLHPREHPEEHQQE